MIQYTIGANNPTLLDCLFDLLKVDRGDVIEINRDGDNGLYIKKVKHDSAKALEALERVADYMGEDNFFEKAGFKTEQDVADFINELRNAKSHS